MWRVYTKRNGGTYYVISPSFLGAHINENTVRIIPQKALNIQ